MKHCPQCHTELPLAARFCWSCGAAQPAPDAAVPGGSINWRAPDLISQFNAHFLAALRQWVQDDLGSERWTEYQELLYTSGFRDTAHRRLAQLADQLATDDRHHPSWQPDRAERSLADLVDDLLTFFGVMHAAHLNPVPLSEAILRYQGARLPHVNLFQMALDYLDFAHEQEAVYTDLLHMPVEKLRAAGRSYLFPAKDERILLVCDQSLLGSGKEGFALTEKALYWKVQLQPAQVVAFQDLHNLRREKSWLLLNGKFFHAGPGLDTKMLLLLRKLVRLYQTT